MSHFPVDLPFVLFAADIGDIVAGLVGLLFVIVPVVGQLLANANKGKQPGQAQGGGAAAPGGNRPANPGVDREVAEFLRRVAQNQAGGGRPAEAGPPAQAAPQPQDRPGMRPAQAGRQLPPRPGVRQVERPRQAAGGAARAVQAQVVPTEPIPAEKGADRLGTSDRFGSKSRLGIGVEEELRKEEQRRRKTFSQGRDTLKERPVLGGTESGEPAKRPVPAVDWAAMLANVSNVRQAIVLSEILQRPEHRWS